MAAMSTAPRHPDDLEFVAVSLDAARLLFELRNDPFIVGLSRSGRPVTWDEHVPWLERCLASPDRHRIYFLKQHGRTIGVLRFDREGEEGASITIFLLQDATGRGLGTEAIRRSCAVMFEAWNVKKILADVIAGNDRSLRAFRKTGFIEATGGDAKAGWTMVLPAPGAIQDGDGPEGGAASS